ncbi:hypothetical protein AB4Z52_34375 [Rhizobium sp. 2YAF20]|uniref:hypothetical protein n=1 Tax=Rhizobium sp. 2YAF20 TaxID=3233027 RepID=UPI003F98C93F
MKTSATYSFASSDEAQVPHPLRYSRFVNSADAKLAIACNFRDFARSNALDQAHRYVRYVSEPCISSEFISVFDVQSLIPHVANLPVSRETRFANLNLDRSVFLMFGRKEKLCLIPEAKIYIEGVYARKTVYSDIELEFVIDDSEFSKRPPADVDNHIYPLSILMPVLVDGREPLASALHEIRDTAKDKFMLTAAFKNAYWTAVKALLYLCEESHPDLELDAKSMDGQGQLGISNRKALKISPLDDRVVRVGRNRSGLTSLPVPVPSTEIMDASRSMALPTIERRKGGLDLYNPLSAESIANMVNLSVSRGPGVQE